MPADQPNIGMGRRRQGDTEPDRSDDRNRSLDRAIGEELRTAGTEDYDRGKEAGASGADTAHREVKPGTRSAIEDSGVNRDSGVNPDSGVDRARDE
ncbi:MAG TPA: hypothetical protein VK929_03055 [Longimicrobiales bacterium]|nr:hypothetical protein [Longimicrobiales bacterium]